MNFHKYAENQTTALVLLLITLPVLFLSCVKATVIQPNNTFQYASFRDIPGVTENEITAIEAMQKQFDRFAFGMIPSTESFYDDNGELKGFSVLFCEWLSGLFDIPFIPENDEFNDLQARLARYDVDFTGSLTATEERRETYFMTTPIALHTIQYFRIAGGIPLEIIAESRPIRYAFMAGATTIDLVTSKLTPGTYEIVLSRDIDEVYLMLKSGYVDAAFNVNRETAFDVYGDVVSSNFNPLIYTSASLATLNPALEPIISIIQKALDNGALSYLVELYNKGHHEYQKNKLSMQFTDEERTFIKDNPIIPFTTPSYNYPVSFYNERELEWQGIALDVIKEIEALTGLRFERVNDANIRLPAMLQLLADGKASMITQMMRSAEREEKFIWPKNVYMVEYTALISRSDYRNISLNEILYAKVGLISGTAPMDMFIEWFPDHLYTKEYASIGAAFDALENGEVDMVMVISLDLQMIMNYMERTGFKTNYIFENPIDFTFAFKKDDVVLCSIVNKALGMINTNKISDEWKLKIYDYRRKLFEAQRPWLFGSSALLLSALALVVVLFARKRRTGKYLEKLVGERTRELALQSAKLQAVFDSIPDIVFCKDMGLRYTQVNKISEAYTGIKEADVIGKNDLETEIFPVNIANHIMEMDRDTLSKGQKTAIEEIVPYADGIMRTLETVRSPLVQNGVITGLIVIARDITQRKEIERELAMQTATLTTLFDSIPDLIFVKDLDFRYMQCNKSFLEHLGVRKEDLIGKDDLSGLHLDPELVEEYREWDRKVMREDRMFSLEERIPGAKGTNPLYETVKTPLVLDGKVIGLLGISHNITERKEMEEAAKTANRSKSAFLANMSHEIRTPMNSIMGFSEFALDGEASPKTRDYLAKIKTNTEWLLQIINDILDISKIESGRMELENIPFDIQELFASCRTLIAPKAAEKGIALHFYAEPSIGKMPLGDPTRLRQVFVNLLSNAVKFTNFGTVKMLVEIKDKTEKNVTMHFEIKDSGIGMTQEQIEKIFDPFTQAESGTTRQYGGTGLGLSITKNMVELMGGRLSVESTPGVGSRFCFDLMFDTVDVSNESIFERKSVFNEIEKPMFDGEVLLCEDNIMNQQVIREHLSRVGLKTVIAENGKIGVEMVQERIKKGEKQFDLIFMDMHMPVMDGIEAFAKIMEMGTDVPIVAMTANIMSSDLEVYKQSGMSDCVGKPFTSQDLWRCLLKYFKPLNGKTVIGNEPPGMDDSLPETDEEFQKKIQKSFVRGSRDKHAEIVKALKDGDTKLAHRLAHSLKSNAGQIGREALQKAAADIEGILKEGGEPSAGQLELLKAELDAVLGGLSHLNGGTSPGNGDRPLDAEAVRGLFENLEPMLRLGNPESMGLVNSLRRIPENGELVSRLIQQIEDFYFEEAAITLDELKKKLAI